jgi:hypothetical protein
MWPPPAVLGLPLLMAASEVYWRGAEGGDGSTTSVTGRTKRMIKGAAVDQCARVNSSLQPRKAPRNYDMMGPRESVIC